MAALPTPPPAAARKIPEETAGSANGAAVADPTFLGRRGRRDAHIYLPSTFGGGGRDPSLLTVFRASPKEPVGWGPGSLEGAAARGGAPLPWVWDLPFAQDKRIHPGRGIVRPPRFPETHKKNLVGVGGGGEGHVDSPGSPHVLSPSLSILRAPGPRSGQSPHPRNQVQSAALSKAAEPTHVLQGGFRSCLSQPRFPSAIQPDHVRCKGLCLALLHAWGTLRCVWAGARQALLGARPSVGRMDTPLTPEPPWD